ncbi:MAG TPA: Ca2+-dependent phosphoinositide-specific phospholipase C [Polyangiaceae bacterium]|nr:Ca2+-dependent phosphoinositide-specific phospholipase C [Polyangiaceae bacterium]
MPSSHWLFLAVFACVPACSENSRATSGGPSASDGGGDGSVGADLRITQLQAKGTHNSYHVETPGTPIPDWQYSEKPLDVQLESEGVRAVELDTHFDEAAHLLRVYHVPGVDQGTTCQLFTDCLTTIRVWSDAHPKHHVLFVHIEPKEAALNQTVDFAAYADLMDETILSVWSRERIVAPADVQGTAATLRDAVTTTGFPSIESTRGKVLFYLNERAGFHDAYTRGGDDISGRIVFPESHVDEPIGGVVILNDPLNDPIADAVGQGFLVRTSCDGVPRPADTDARREAALASGAHIVSTDYPDPTAVDAGGSAFVMPGGTPSRCNPKTAPESCTSESIEKL